VRTTGYPDSTSLPQAGRQLPRIVRGEACWLYDEPGKGYLDAGRRLRRELSATDPEIAEALARQRASSLRLGHVRSPHRPGRRS